MDVIKIESDAFKSLLSKIEDIERYIKNTSALFVDIEDTLEMTTREVIETLGTSDSTLYRWRQDKLVRFRYDKKGSVLFFFKDIYLAIKCSRISLQGKKKIDLLSQMAKFKDEFVRNKFLDSIEEND